MSRIYSLTPKSRITAVALAVGVVGVGVVIVFVGFAVLAALTVTGAVLGTGIGAYRWLRGSRILPQPRTDDLDPALEVRPPVRVVPAPVDRGDPGDQSTPSSPLLGDLPRVRTLSRVRSDACA